MNYIENNKFTLLKKSDGEIINKILKHFINESKNIYIYDECKKLYTVITKNDFHFLFTNVDKLYENQAECYSLEEYKNGCIHTQSEYYLIMNDNKILFEMYKTDDSHLNIDNERFNQLYANNKKIADYFSNYSNHEIYILGKNNRSLYNYLILNTNLQVTKIENLLNCSELVKNNALIIDTDIDMIENRKLYLNHLMITDSIAELSYHSINYICDEAEYLYFINLVCKEKIKTKFYEFQMPNTLEKLTFSEKLRISFDKHYRYYYNNYKSDREIYEITKKVFKSSFSDEFIDSRNSMPATILKNGICFLQESNNKYCSSVNGLRYTDNVKLEKSNKINFFGVCLVFGALVDDNNTIPSLAHKMLVKKGFHYNAYNYGARAISFYENIRVFDTLTINENDLNIFVVSPEEAKKLSKNGVIIKKLSLALNNSDIKDYFLGEPVHCNAEANEVITKFIIEDINKDLTNVKTDKIVKQENKNECISGIMNTQLKKFLLELKKVKKGDNNGAVMMNCNPFTNGHLQLIEYASKSIDTLYVFVVQEDRSKFKFVDRLKMVQKGCKHLKNVVVLGSGTLFGSFITFSAYFEKDVNNNVQVDPSLDIDIFGKYVAPTLNIKKRFAGEELNDKVTNEYNNCLSRALPKFNIELEIVPRFKYEDELISAKSVRKYVEERNMEMLKMIVPNSTYEVITEKYLKEEMYDFIEKLEYVPITDYLNSVNKQTLLIYSEKSIDILNWENKNKNIILISTKNLTKDIIRINDIVENNNNFEEIVSFGGGTAADIGKYISFLTNKKLICIVSMLSTNAYSTDKVALYVGNKKETLLAKTPDSIILDTSFLKKSDELNILGLIDVLSIGTALEDWKLDSEINNFPIDEIIFKKASKLYNDICDFIEYNNYLSIVSNYNKLYEFIGISGFITNEYGTGKPESGSEHIFAKELEAKIDVPHGIAVSIGIVVMEIYQNQNKKKTIEFLKKLKVDELIKKYKISLFLIEDILFNIKPRSDRFSIINIKLYDEEIKSKINENLKEIGIC